MARRPTSRRQETLYVPFIEQSSESTALWVVKVREGLGCNFIVTAPLPRRMAKRRMREFRKAMFEAWLESRRLT